MIQDLKKINHRCQMALLTKEEVMSGKVSRIVTVVLAITMIALAVGCVSPAVRSAKIYLQQDDYANAKQILLEGAEVTPQDPELWYILGKVHAEMEEYVEMNVAFDKALAISDQFKEDIKLTRYDEWREAYNIAVTPFNEKAYDEAIGILEVALQIKPGDAETLTRMGLCYLQLGNLEVAKEKLVAGIEGSETPEVSTLYNILIIDWRQQDYEAVIAGVDRILGLGVELEDDKKVDVLQKKALAMQQLGRVDEAIAQWDVAIAENPTNGDYHYNKAILLHGAEKYDEAAEAYLKSIELNPDDEEARMNAARSLLASKKWDILIQVLEPMLFPGGEVVVHETERLEMDPWLILRAAYMNTDDTAKSDVVAQILVQIQKKNG
jgi:tetratricopeptide (TPR) repeat protein